LFISIGVENVTGESTGDGGGDAGCDKLFSENSSYELVLEDSSYELVLEDFSRTSLIIYVELCFSCSIRISYMSIVN
jgi:hypothetical protein